MSKAIDNYVLKQIIGQGQYGKVYKAFNTQTYALYAVKVIKADKFKQVPKLQQFTLNQIKVLSKIEHPNIVRFVQMLKTSNNMYLIYQYCEHGTLQELINKKKYLSEAETISIAKQMLDAFRVLSDHNILHRDIKPSNILFNNGVIKLADFGFCKLLAPNEMANTMVGSPIYMAPEILKGSPYTTKADIWSFGVVLYECLYGFCPYEDKSIGRLIKMIDNKDLYFPPVPKISRELTDVIKKMLTVIPSKRISWQELLQSEVFKQQPPKSNLFLNKLQDIEFYKSVESPRITSRSEEQNRNIVSNFIRFLTKQRRKVLFVTRVVEAVARCTYSSNSIRICQLLLSRCKDLYSRMFHAIRNLDGNHQYTQTQRNQIKNSKQLSQFVQIVTGQKMNVDECYKMYKLASPMQSQQPTLKLFTQQILQYIHQVKSGVSTNDSRAIKQRYLHCNQLLDCIMLMELFENYIGGGEEQEQRHWASIANLPREQLLKIVDHKIKYAQKKYKNL